MLTKSRISTAIMANEQSPYVKLRATNFGDCQWTEGFWADKQQQAQDVMVPHMGELLKGDVGHAYNNFKVAAGLEEGDAKGMLWHDGDFYKWMEACCYVYKLSGNDAMITELEEIISVFAQVITDDGYIHTHNQILGKPRYKEVCDHELYNSGHFITGAIIYKRLTGRTSWFDLAIRHADYLFDVFGTTDPELARFGFNPSQIMSLVELYRETQNQKYLKLADIFVTMRGSVPMGLHDSVPYWFTGDQCQMKTPLREETEAVGHAVTGMYLYSGAADVYAETGEKALIDALERIWASAVERKMYVTGALGQCHHGAYDDQNMIHEGFIDDYMLPNSTAYNETCANISNAMFNWRMLGIHGDAKYADIMELVLFNSALVGISDDGKHYFYANPLRFNHGQREYSDHCDCTESADREAYIECFCCPPNLVRTIAQMSGWAYSIIDNGISVNLYGGNTLDTLLRDGSAVKLTQTTQYPWKDTIAIRIDECPATAFDIQVRIPGWVRNPSLTVNGKALETPLTPSSFAKISRTWQAGDIIELTLPMPVEMLEGHPRVEEIRNQVAVKRGPLVYCVESPDLPEQTGILDVFLDSQSDFNVVEKESLLGGVSVIEANMFIRKDSPTTLYSSVQKPQWESFKTQLVPYYAWSNRGTSEMSVFLPVLWQA